jgi:hypothetical protein
LLRKAVVAVVRQDELCGPFMGIPGVGLITALASAMRIVIQRQNRRHSNYRCSYFRSSEEGSAPGQDRLCRPRSTTVRLSFHSRPGAALPRTGGLGQLRTKRRKSIMVGDNSASVPGLSLSTKQFGLETAQQLALF